MQVADLSQSVLYVMNVDLYAVLQHADVVRTDGSFDLVERILQRLELERMHLTVGERLQTASQYNSSVSQALSIIINHCVCLSLSIIINQSINQSVSRS